MPEDTLLHPNLAAELGSGIHTVLVLESCRIQESWGCGIFLDRQLQRPGAIHCVALEWCWGRQGVRGARVVRHLPRRAAHRAWSPL